jgi:hypothetical protein
MRSGLLETVCETAEAAKVQFMGYVCREGLCHVWMGEVRSPGFFARSKVSPRSPLVHTNSAPQCTRPAPVLTMRLHKEGAYISTRSASGAQYVNKRKTSVLFVTSCNTNSHRVLLSLRRCMIIDHHTATNTRTVACPTQVGGARC